jgi:hypothetical protein
MTEHNEQNKSASATTAGTYETFINALEGLSNENEFRDALRDFVKRGAETAKSRSAELHTGATKATAAIENALIRTVTGLADANRKVANAALQEVGTTCAMVDKLVGAGSIEEASKAYFDYLRHQNEVGLSHVRAVAGFATAKSSEAFESFREGAATLLPMWLRGA